MADGPRLLCGNRAIADHLGISTKAAEHMIVRRLLPAWRVGGTPMATATGLDEWSQMKRSGKF